MFIIQLFGFSLHPTFMMKGHKSLKISHILYCYARTELHFKILHYTTVQQYTVTIFR